jgi:hypothetical protein
VHLLKMCGQLPKLQYTLINKPPANMDYAIIHKLVTVFAFLPAGRQVLLRPIQSRYQRKP